MTVARPRQAFSRLRVKAPKRVILPLSVDEVAQFWSSFRTSRDLAIVCLMLLQGYGRKKCCLSTETICSWPNHRSAYVAKAAKFDSCHWPRNG